MLNLSALDMLVLLQALTAEVTAARLDGHNLRQTLANAFFFLSRGLEESF